MFATTIPTQHGHLIVTMRPGSPILSVNTRSPQATAALARLVPNLDEVSQGLPGAHQPINMAASFTLTQHGPRLRTFAAWTGFGADARDVTGDALTRTRRFVFDALVAHADTLRSWSSGTQATHQLNKLAAVDA